MLSTFLFTASLLSTPDGSSADALLGLLIFPHKEIRVHLLANTGSFLSCGELPHKEIGVHLSANFFVGKFQYIKDATQMIEGYLLTSVHLPLCEEVPILPYKKEGHLLTRQKK
jgi:hypothetical protein